MSRPRIRTVKPEMRKDERYGRMTRDARELFNGMITIADDEGRFRALSSSLVDLFPYDDDAPRLLKKWVAEIKDSGMVLFYIVEGVPYGAFRNWRRHQRINKPIPSELPAPPDPEVVRANYVREPGGRRDTSGSSPVDVRDAFNSPASAGAPILSLTRENDEGGGTIDARADEYLRLSHKLAANILGVDAGADVHPDGDRWLGAIRLLHERDGRSLVLIEEGIDWLTTDDKNAQFWSTVILSAPALRKKFTQLVAKMHGPRPTTSAGRVSAGDLIDEMIGDAA